eukprot:TRINITY_DN2479_c0_g1_i1.p1 TRINITY_DN2479_c0_g1~~TRINITY_DN2479_c0_g1_i1.p1  ORF type:complete len:551 (+),score=120.55 TRINITY_DN2479_c0_g1_i1:148-1800(+)
MKSQWMFQLQLPDSTHTVCSFRAYPQLRLKYPPQDLYRNMGCLNSKQGKATNQEKQELVTPKAGGGVSGQGQGGGKQVRASNVVLGKETADVASLYNLGKVLGRGQFGITRLATDKNTNEKFACKTISKRKLTTKEDIEDVRREVQIMHHLAGYKHIVTLKGAYEDRYNVHIVMELCSGGELFDRIVEKGHYSEKMAAELIRTIVSVVAHCHSMNVIHRDLKPENFLLADASEKSMLKATDFGLSVFFKPGQQFTDVVGSAYYVAPEVLNRKYSYYADIWSCGVILYILLSGVPPFWGENEQQIFNSILKGHLDLESAPWPKISGEAKDCVRQMLQRDPQKRATADQILQHEWMKENGVARDEPLGDVVVGRLKGFSAMNKLKKEALKVIALNLPEEEIAGLKSMFQTIDTDKSGTITVDELRQAIKDKGQALPDTELRGIMENVDVDSDGVIDYEEFLAATMHISKLEKDENLFKAFQHFDKDNSGYITIDELRDGLDKFSKDVDLEQILKEVDKDGNGRIDYEEFCDMMRQGNALIAGGGSTRTSVRF